MRVGDELLALAKAGGDGTIFVVGIGRDAGKTTTVRAIYFAAVRKKLRVALASVGRDRGTLGDGAAKPRLWLSPGTCFVSAVGVLPQSPACRVFRVSSLQTPSGNILFAGVETPGPYEVTGPPTAAGMRDVIAELRERSDLVIVDGAVDRVAALAGTRGAVIVAAGAADSATVAETALDTGALVARLRVPGFDAEAPGITVENALTETLVGRFIAERESRQIVVNDPTQIALRGRAAAEAFARLRIRCRRPLRVVAATVASAAAERQFEPVDFGTAVANATQLPTFDVYRGARAA
ncbi:MAG: hypothetical protein JO078_09475 [Candidatus Eremiobacteraeota bacterium]|nr:hypothetical protein [Candidatus Eremiobacteraeota bacterium]MBV9055934.1 hypothetical protein [Candidatus Eremiobacteraeota bacterium]MBV9700341.1 hypothetical protein [Candidatus Eremiobacteraeota bacterium]